MMTSQAAGHHRHLTNTKLRWLVTEARVCEQVAQGCYLKAKKAGSGTRNQQVVNEF